MTLKGSKSRSISNGSSSKSGSKSTLTTPAFELTRFCSKRLFQVVIVNETTPNAGEALCPVFDEARKYENLCTMTVVSYDDVMDFLKNFQKDRQLINLPADILPALPDILGDAVLRVNQGLLLSATTMAKVIKLKLIHIMYQQYAQRVANMSAFGNLEDELKILSKDKNETVTKKTSGKSSTAKSSAKTEGGRKAMIDADLTEIELVANPVVVTDAFENQVWFFVLSGFFDANILPSLVSINVPVDVVLEIILKDDDSVPENSTQKSQEFIRNLSDIYPTADLQVDSPKIDDKIDAQVETPVEVPQSHDNTEAGIGNLSADGNDMKDVSGKATSINTFWSRLHELLFGSSRSEQLEKTVWMKYEIVKDKVESAPKKVLEEMLDVMLTIHDLKLDHLNYIRNVKLGILSQTEKHLQFPMDFRIYTKLLDTYPNECVDIPIILECLLEEMCNKMDCTDQRSRPLIVDGSKNETTSVEGIPRGDCLCPFSFNYFVPRRRKRDANVKNDTQKDTMPYQIHEGNELEKFLRAYKAIGRSVYDINVKYLQQIPPISFLDNYNTDCIVDVKHTHERSDSGCTISEFTDEEVIHYISCLLLFRLQCPSAAEARVPGAACAATAGLHMREAAERLAEVLPTRVLDPSVRPSERSRHRRPCSANLYELRLLTRCGWSEALPRALLLQELARCNGLFCCRDHVYCDEAGALLVRYHDAVDHFGLSTRVWSQALRTPVCLRDFCRYVCRDDMEWIRNQHRDEQKQNTSEDGDSVSSKSPKDPMFCDGYANFATVPLYNDYLQFLSSKNIEEEPIVDTSSQEKLAKVLDYSKVSNTLQEECIKEGQFYSYIAYDLGTKRVEVGGSTTVFQSHDGVRITLDTTHFIGSEQNLSLKVSSNDSDLIMHRALEKTSCLLRYVTSDGTTLVIDKPLAEFELKATKETSVSLEGTSTDGSSVGNQSVSMQVPAATAAAAAKPAVGPQGLKETVSVSIKEVLEREEPEGNAPLPPQPPLVTKLSQRLRRTSSLRPAESAHRTRSGSGASGDLQGSTEHQRRESFRRHRLLVPALLAEGGDGDLRRFADNPAAYRVRTASDEILNALAYAVAGEADASLFKFRARAADGAGRTARSGAAAAAGAEVRVPAFTLVKRLLYRHAKLAKCKRYVRRYVPQGGGRAGGVRPGAAVGGGRSELRLTLPHGLCVMLAPSAVCPGQAEVKQSYLSGAHPGRIRHESYRLFTRNGVVLIRYPDGRIDLLKPNGAIVQYDKPFNSRQSVVDMKHGVEVINCFRPPRCKTLRDCQKQVAALLAARHDDTTERFVSRRADFRRQKVTDSGMDLPQTQNRPPYLRRSVLDFEGQRIRVDSEKVTLARECFVTHEFDHRREERFYERDDGMRSLFTKEGHLTVQFPDKSRVTSWFVIEPEPVVINRTMGDWVSVTMGFRFEHPDYASVSYLSESGDLEVVPNELVKLRQHLESDTYSLELCDDVTMDVTDETVRYRKQCKECGSSFCCDIDMAKFVDSNCNSDRDILVARDSYNKVFRMRDVDRYTANTNYISGPSNAFACDHYSWRMYEKMYAIRKDGSGLLLWCNKNVQAKVKEYEKDPNAEVVSRTNIHGFNTLEFLRNVNQHYRERFSHIDLQRGDLALSRYGTTSKPQDVAYVTYRELYEIANLQKFKSIVAGVKEFIERDENVGSNYAKYLINLTDELLNNIDNSEFLKQYEFSSSTTESVDDKPVCKCFQLRFTYREKIDRWRRECQKYKNFINNSVVPLYFASEYYKQSDNESNII